MGYFKSIWGIQLAFSNLMYDYKTDDGNKASKSDNCTARILRSVMFKIQFHMSFVSHVKNQTVNKKVHPIFFIISVSYFCMTHQFVFSFYGKCFLPDIRLAHNNWNKY